MPFMNEDGQRNRWPSPRCVDLRRWGDSNSAPSPGMLPVHGHILSLTCGFSQPIVTADARWAPLAAGRVCTRLVPAGSAPSRGSCLSALRPGMARPILAWGVED
jgi:hypothetical protein